MKSLIWLERLQWMNCVVKDRREEDIAERRCERKKMVLNGAC